MHFIWRPDPRCSLGCLCPLLFPLLAPPPCSHFAESKRGPEGSACVELLQTDKRCVGSVFGADARNRCRDSGGQATPEAPEVRLKLVAER